MSEKLPTTDRKNINRLPTWADIINIIIKGPIVYYVPRWGGGDGFQKSVVFQNFTPPPKIITDENCSPLGNNNFLNATAAPLSLQFLLDQVRFSLLPSLDIDFIAWDKEKCSN